MLHRVTSLLLVVAASTFGAGCATAPPPSAVAPVAAPQKVDRGPSSMESEIGGMNEVAVERAFAKLAEPMLECVSSRTKSVKELGGQFLVSMRIDREGKARWAYLSESTLGDRDAERCIVDVARDAEWPRPVGGEGLASRAFAIDPGAAPVVWEAKRIKTAVRTAAESFARCRKGTTGSFIATAYVRPDGRVASAGIAAPNAEEDEAADCLAGAVEKMRFGSPGRRAAKVTFPVP